MHGDFSRDSFEPDKQYVSVRQQQGRVQLDADWNEQVDIVNHALQVRAMDIIGASGAPARGGGFEVVARNVLVFDGIAAHADLSARKDFSFVDRTPFTLELMVLVEDTERGGTLLCGLDEVGRVWYRLGVDSDGCLRANRGLRGVPVISTPVDWSAPRHVAMVYDGTDLSLYVDGIEVCRERRTDELDIRRLQPTVPSETKIVQTVVVEGQEKVPDRIEHTEGEAGPADSDSAMLALAMRVGTDIREGELFLPLKGEIHWFRIWSTARTADQLQACSGRLIDPNLRGLVGDWPLEEGFGSTAVDRTPVRQELRLDLGRPVNQPRWKLVELYLSPGRFYIDGMACENPRPVPLDQQRNDPGTRMPEHPGVYLAYLDAWLRPVTALRDPNLREVALGGVDTTVRQQLVSQVRLLKLRDDPTAALDGRHGAEEHAWRRLQAQAEVRGGMRARRTRRLGAEPIGNQLYRVEVHRGGARFGTPLVDGAPYASFACALAPGDRETLSLPDDALGDETWVVGQWISLHGADTEHLACIIKRTDGALTIDPAAPEELGETAVVRPVASLIWSRNNGTEVMAVRGASDREIYLERSVDETGHTLQVHDLIAFSTEQSELRRDPAQLLRIQAISPDGRKLHVDRPVAFSGEVLLDTKPIVRRWGRAARKGPLGTPVRDQWLELEHGIEVQFDGLGAHSAGDYWLIPSRAQTRSIQWPMTDTGPALAAPRGGGHRHARLALLRVKDGGLSVHDLRRTFSTLTGTGSDEEDGAVQSTLTVPERLHVTGDATVNGELTAGLLRGVLANGMVDTPQIRDRSVTGSKIGTGAVHLRQINADVGIVPTGSAILGETPHPPPGFDYTHQQVALSNVRPNWRTQAAPPSVGLERAVCVPMGDMLFAIMENGELWCTGGNAGTGWYLDAEMRPIRRDFAATALNGRIHILGGVDESGLPLADHDIYDPHERIWEKGPPLPTPRWGVALAASRGVLFAIGGMQAPMLSTAWRSRLRRLGLESAWFRWTHSVRRVDVYEAQQKRWVRSFSMTQARCNAGVAVFNDRIHVVGGRTKSLLGWRNPIASHEAFSPSQGRWTARMPLAQSRSELGLACVGNSLYAVGGQDRNGATSLVERYEPLSDTWHPAPALATPRRDAGVTGWLGNIYAVGGVGPEGVVPTVAVCTLSQTLYVHRKVALPVSDGTRGHVQYEHIGAPSGPRPGTALAASAAAKATAAAASIAGSGAHLHAARAGTPAIPGAAGGASVHNLQSPEAESAGRAIRALLAAVLIIALFIFLCVGGLRITSRFIQSPQFDQLICEGVAYGLARPLGICEGDGPSGGQTPLGPDGRPLDNTTAPPPTALPAIITPPAPTPACVDPSTAPVINLGTPDPSVVFGVDVSHYQDDVPWKTIRDRGVLFAYAKATEGTKVVDKKFQQNWLMMKECGILRGAYHFYRPDEDPVKQAQHFINTVQALGVGELPLVIDLERGYDKRRKRDCRVVLPNAATFVETVAQSTGHPVMVYSSAPLWNQYFACGAEPNAVTAQATLSSLPLWTAHYEQTAPPLYGRWSTWSMWQYSDRGVLGQGQIDLNRFPGDYTLLSNWLTALASNPSATPAQVEAAAAAAATPAAGAAPAPGTTPSASGTPPAAPRPPIPSEPTGSAPPSPSSSSPGRPAPAPRAPVPPSSPSSAEPPAPGTPTAPGTTEPSDTPEPPGTTEPSDTPSPAPGTSGAPDQPSPAP